MVPSGIKIGKEQLNELAYADYIVLIGKNEIEIRQLLVETENIVRKLGLHVNQGKTKYNVVEWKNSSPTETLFPILLLESVVNFSGRDVFSNEEFDHNALFHAPRYLL